MKLFKRLIGTCLMAGAACVMAQPFPSKSIRLVAAAAPGGPTDVMAREFAVKMSAALGQPVVVENKAGASGLIGAQAVVDAPADGYTLLFGTNGPLSSNVALFKKMPYDPLKDFAPITLVAFSPNVLGVNPQVSANSLKELLTLARNEPDKLTFAAGGNGTTQHLSGELLKMLANVDIRYVPYKSGGPALADVMAGHVNMMFAGLPESLQHVRSGKLRALAVTADKRNPQLPDVPTMAEAGLPDFKMMSWFGVVAPARTPPEVIDHLNKVITKIISQDLAEKLALFGATPAPSTPAEFAAFLKADIPRWEAVVKASGARLD